MWYKVNIRIQLKFICHQQHYILSILLLVTNEWFKQ